MVSGPASPITRLLDATAQGDAVALNRLWFVVCGEVRCIARGLAALDSTLLTPTYTPAKESRRVAIRLVREHNALQ